MKSLTNVINLKIFQINYQYYQIVLSLLSNSISVQESSVYLDIINKNKKNIYFLLTFIKMRSKFVFHMVRNFFQNVLEKY